MLQSPTLGPPSPNLDALFAAVDDVSWSLSNILGNVVGMAENNQCVLLCLCGEKVVRNDDRFCCRKRDTVDDCGFVLYDRESLLFYVKNVLAKLFNISMPAHEFIVKHNVLWLRPVCKCGTIMSLGIWKSSLQEGLYCKAKCSNEACQFQYIRLSVVIAHMKEFFRKYPHIKAGFAQDMRLLCI